MVLDALRLQRLSVNAGVGGIAKMHLRQLDPSMTHRRARCRDYRCRLDALTVLGPTSDKRLLFIASDLLLQGTRALPDPMQPGRDLGLESGPTPVSVFVYLIQP